MSKQEKLNSLKETLKVCKACAISGVKVFDNGSPNADIIIIAEAPGADEEKQGMPLVGKCGVLIEQMLNHIGLSRKETWRANCLVCRPPGNRNPEEKELDNCQANLLKQIEIIEPKIIIVLGKFAAQEMLDTKISITKLRGQWYDSEESDVALFVTFHPSFVLRGGCTIEDYKSDFVKVKDKLESIRSEEQKKLIQRV